MKPSVKKGEKYVNKKRENRTIPFQKPLYLENSPVLGNDEKASLSYVPSKTSDLFGK